MAKFDANSINTNLFPQTAEKMSNDSSRGEKISEAKKGRPYLTPQAKRTRHVNITLKEKEAEAIIKFAANRELSMSSFIQQLIKDFISGHLDELEA